MATQPGFPQIDNRQLTIDNQRVPLVEGTAPGRPGSSSLAVRRAWATAFDRDDSLHISHAVHP